MGERFALSTVLNPFDLDLLGDRRLQHALETVECE
jgi:hypothetical protein